MSVIKKLTDREIDERVAIAMQPPIPDMSMQDPAMLLNELLGVQPEGMNQPMESMKNDISQF